MQASKDLFRIVEEKISQLLIVIPVKRSEEPESICLSVDSVSSLPIGRQARNDDFVYLPITTVQSLISHFSINPFLT